MNANTSAIQYMGMIMRLEQLNVDYVLSMVEIVNHSYLSAKDIVTILQQIFKNEKSSKILLATQVLEYLIKNSNRNFHQAANKESFQKSVLSLLKRQRGKMNIIKELRSNSENWSRIESKILYLVQLWYDAFILEESKYPYIINTYKILRKQNIIFPPRNVNERSLMAIQTQSPIFDNIQTISQADKQKFKKRLNGLGLTDLTKKFEQKQKIIKNAPPARKQINIDQISEKIAIIQSQDYDLNDALKVIEQVKKAIEFGKVKPNEQKYWKQVKQAAETLIQEWQQKNAHLIQNKQQQYLESKMNGKIKKTTSAKEELREQKGSKTVTTKSEIKANIEKFDLLDLEPQVKKVQQVDEWGQFSETRNQPQSKKPKEVNLLDM